MVKTLNQARYEPSEPHSYLAFILSLGFEYSKDSVSRPRWSPPIRCGRIALMSSKTDTKTTSPTLPLLGEALGLLRSAPLSAHALYLMGTLPFLAAIIYLWHRMAPGTLQSGQLEAVAWYATLSFVWMKTFHALYGMSLRAKLEQKTTASTSVQTSLRLMLCQTPLHAISLYFIPLSLVLLLPFGWVYAYAQNLCAVADPELGLRETHKKAKRLALYAPMQNHLLIWLINPYILILCAASLVITLPIFETYIQGASWVPIVLISLFLLVMSPVSLVIALNVTMMLYAIPYLLNTLFGIETFALRSGVHFLNTTTLVIVCAITYLILDPLTKAAYVLRCFYAHGVHSGEDLCVRLRSITSASRALLFLLPLVFLATPEVSHAESASVQSAELSEFESKVQEELKHPRYAWRLRAPMPEEQSEAGWFENMLLGLVDYLEENGQGFADAMERFFEWWANLFDFDMDRKERNPSETNWEALLQGMLKLALVLLIVALVIILIRMGRSKRNQPVISDTIHTESTPDLEAEEINPESLPSDKWLILASEMVAKGEYRLAARACFLSGLATLGKNGWILLSQSKTNREYEFELSHRKQTIPEAFAAYHWGRATFERVWYGDHIADAALVESLRENLRRMEAQ